MRKGSFWSDTFEQLAELGKSTAQKTGQALKSLIIPKVQKIVSSDEGSGLSKNQPTNNAAEKDLKQNFTPLDNKRLDQHYEKQDEKKLVEIREFFARFKTEEKQAVEEHKKEEVERKQKEEQEKQQKKKREIEKQEEQEVQAPLLPKGKERKSIFSPQKTAKRAQAETRVGAGKQ